MDTNSRGYAGALNANLRTAPFDDDNLSIIDLSNAPPAYARYDHNTQAAASTSSSSRVSPPTRTSRESPNSRNTTDHYHCTGGHKSSRSTSKYTKPRDHRTILETSAAGCRSAPDYSVSTNGELLSEKDPRGQATQTHGLQSIPSPHLSHASHPRSPHHPATRTQYPPTASRDEGSSLCGCFNSLPPKLKLWLSFGAWIATSIGFILAVAFWKTEVFTALDNLSGWLVEEGYTGYAYMFALIVLTTIPPFPLYSTLMMLAGYTWGTWTGFLISYSSSLFGAIVVYFISRFFFGSSLVSLLRHMPTFARTVRAVSRNPKLLFLVRLAPYPYNVMNVLLAACPSLRWRTYIGCTGFSLLKVVIHTSIGSGIRSFKSYHGVGEEGIDGELTEDEQRSSDLAKWSTVVGVILCILLFVYLGHVARKAVDVELEDEDFDCPNNGSLLPIHHRLRDDLPRPSYSPSRHQREPSTAEERMAFLSPVGNDSDEEDGVEMSESRLGGSLVGSRNTRR